MGAGGRINKRETNSILKKKKTLQSQNSENKTYCVIVINPSDLMMLLKALFFLVNVIWKWQKVVVTTTCASRACACVCVCVCVCARACACVCVLQFRAVSHVSLLRSECNICFCVSDSRAIKGKLCVLGIIKIKQEEA